MKRRKLSFRHAPKTLMDSIRVLNGYVECAHLWQLSYNAPLADILAAAESDSLLGEMTGKGMIEAAQRLSSKVYAVKHNSTPI